MQSSSLTRLGTRPSLLQDSDIAVRKRSVDEVDAGGFALLKRSAAAPTVSTRGLFAIGASVLGLAAIGLSI